MRPILISNIETLESQPFFVAILYGEDGYLLDEIVIQFDSWTQIIEKVRDIQTKYRLETIELWTSTKGLYIESLKHAGIAALFKHPSDTIDTRKLIENNIDTIRDFYELQPKMPKPAPPKWKAFLFRLLTTLLNRLGVDRYEFEV